MFGIIVSGRVVQTNFEQVVERHFLSTVVDADNINHIVVFLTGTTPFPDGTAGLIYFSWPDPNAPPSWHLLGYISNEKPSAVFKISGLKKTSEEQSGFLQFAQHAISHNAQIGIAIEPLNIVQEQITMLETFKPSEQSQFTEYCKKTLKNFVNYISSFSTLQQDTYVVPLPVVQNWYQNFEAKLAVNPYFWRS